MDQPKQHHGKPIAVLLWVAIVAVIVGMWFMFDRSKGQPKVVMPTSIPQPSPK